jgi:hypothetical protein
LTIWRDPLKIENKRYISPAVSNAVLDDCRKHVTNPIDLLASREREVLRTLVKKVRRLHLNRWEQTG